jgi:hypothetical protein
MKNNNRPIMAQFAGREKIVMGIERRADEYN